MEYPRLETLRRVRRMVVKLGSSVLSGSKPRLDFSMLRRLSGDVAALKTQQRQVILVSSGAILAGREQLALGIRPMTTQLKQAAAAVGQSRLMRAWDEAFAREKITAAQVLLTREDLRQRRRYLNARNTLFTLLRLGVVPVINENDTVSTDEIKFGDNDMLSALVAGLCDADLLVLLTDRDGLYSADPRDNPGARLIARVSEGEALVLRGRPGPAGSGGMASKFKAAQLAAGTGISTVIANGFNAGILQRVLAGEEVGTLFIARASPLDKRRQWLAFAAHPRGQIHVDEGAREALAGKSKSLLPSGIKSVSKSFEAGDVVSLVSGGVEFARGLANYSSKELDKIKGLKTSQIEAALGYKPADEVVHRDNMAVLTR